MTSSQRHPPDRARAVNTRNRQIWLTRDRRHSEFPFRVLEVNHIIMRSGGGQGIINYLELLCAHCNRVKCDRPLEYLVPRMQGLDVA